MAASKHAGLRVRAWQCFVGQVLIHESHENGFICVVDSSRRVLPWGARQDIRSSGGTGEIGWQENRLVDMLRGFSGSSEFGRSGVHGMSSEV